MPSSMIFVGLVVLWLLILVPAVARRQQEVARPSPAALSGRVLARPGRQRSLEVYQMDLSDAHVDDAQAGDEPDGAPHLSTGEPAHHPAESVEWDQQSTGFRRGRGGFDAEAAALAARARYAFRQRVVLGLFVLAVGTGVAAGFGWPVLWWAHAAADLALVGYLVYLRRQVKLEEAIRARRAARMAGTRRARPVERDPGHPVADPYEPVADQPDGETPEPDAESPRPASGSDHVLADDEDMSEDDWTADDGTPERVRGTGEPVGVLPARRRSVGGDEDDEIASALPPLGPSPTPPLPAGTQLVDVDAEEDELEGEGIEVAAPRTYLRAAGE